MRSVTIQSRTMPNFPNTVAYQITGISAELVQLEIDRLFNQVEQVGGCAEFDTPKRKGDSYYSGGYTFLQSPQKAMTPQEIVNFVHLKLMNR